MYYIKKWSVGLWSVIHQYFTGNMCFNQGWQSANNNGRFLVLRNDSAVFNSNSNRKDEM